MFISIIIPCYNVEKYVERTVDSVLSQIGDSNRFEIILVNDGSTDGTIEIMQDIAMKVPQVVLLNQANGGVSAARNLGLSVAKGEYVYFLDADDTISPDFINSLTQSAPTDVFLVGYQRLFPNGKSKKYFPIQSNDHLKDYLLNHQKICCCCSIIFKRSFLEAHGLCFLVGTHYGEDRELVRQALFYAKTIEVIPLVLFTYYANPVSVTHIPYSIKRLTSLYAMERSYQELRGTRYEPYAFYALCVTIIYNYGNYLKTTPDKSLESQFLPYLNRLHFPSLCTFCINKYWIGTVTLIALKYVSKTLFDSVLKKIIN
ncbi:glycosyltransferase [Parabacteroides sp.]|uniref:glycosyltransferase family 2 protein n=1 Tax=Parabacteroides sp. TaxID=1869337 RepID=UPI00257B3A10|nr:glycosyltransferase [Parabacteroides sp.]